MGNYYRYNMITEDVSDALNVFKSLDMDFDSKVFLENLLEFRYASSKKWDMIKDMCKLSGEIPNKSFCVQFTHEDTESSWRVLFVDGKYTCVELSYPEFDLNNLVEP